MIINSFRRRVWSQPPLTAIAAVLSVTMPLTALAQQAEQTLPEASPPSAVPAMPALPSLPKLPTLPVLPATPGAPGAVPATPPAAENQPAPAEQPPSGAPTLPPAQLAFPTNAQMSAPVLQGVAPNGGGAVAPQGLQVKLGASGQEKWTDNSYLTATNRRPDFISSADPSVSISDASRRVNFGLNYDMGYDRYVENSKLSGFRHNGIGLADAELLDQVLFIDTRASISEQAVNPAAPSTGGTRTSPTNNSLVTTYTVTPRFQEHLGRWALLQISYSHDRTLSQSQTVGGTNLAQALSEFPSSNQSTASTATDDSGKVELHSGENFSRLLWDYTGEVQHHDASNIDGYRQISHTFQTEYKLSSDWGLLSEVGDDDLSNRTIDNHKFGGVFYSGGLHWTPSPRTDLRVGYGRRYASDNVYALGQYNFSPRTILRLSQQTGVTTNSQSFADALNAVQRDASGAFVNPFSGLAATPTTSPFGATAGVYRQRTSDVVLSHAGDQDTTSLSVQYAEQQPVSSTPAVDTLPLGSALSGSTTTGTVGWQWSHQFNGSLSSKMAADLSDVLTANTSTAKSKTVHASLGFTYLLSPTLSSLVSFQHQDTWQPMVGAIREEMVMIGLQKSF